MRDLGPDRLSDDGQYVLLRDPSGLEDFRVPADRRLRALIDAASRTRERSRGQMEITMQSTLSPRDIQTRIRRGESVAQVAEAAGVPTEQIEGFAGPVLAERAHMVEQARRTPVRRKHVGGAGVMLGSVVGERLTECGQSPDDAAWDAWRREDGRWLVVVDPSHGPQARFLFDHKSRFVLPTDEAAHDLVGDVALAESPEMAIADALQAGEPTLPVGIEDSVEAPVETDAVETPEPVQTQARISSLKEARDRRAQEQQLSLQDVEEDEEDPSEDDHEDHAEEDDAQAEDPRIAVPDTMGPRKKKAERRRVPSWDEIMFGGRED